MRPEQRAARAAAYERARPEILAHVPTTATRVLDLGCATGATGAALKQRQAAHVTGIELEPEYAEEARSRLDAVITGDVAQAHETLGTFDALIAADILEHLSDPWTTLRALRRITWSQTRPPSSASPTSPTGAPTPTCPRPLAAQARRHLRRHPPALVHPPGRPRPAHPGRPARPTRSSGAAGCCTAAHASTASRPRSRCSRSST